MPAALEDSITGAAFMTLAEAVVKQVDRRNAEMAPTKRVEVR